MIEINLIQKKKKSQLPTILGIDLNNLNFKMIMFAMVVYYGSDIVVGPILSGNEDGVQQEIDRLRKDYKKAKAALRDSKGVKAKLNEYNKQLEKLEKRSTQVDSIIKKRTNPKKLLEKFARDMPDDLWFNSLTISDKRQINIEGGAKSHLSIGDFINRANETLFYGQSITLKKASTVEDKIEQGKRVELFSIEGKVKVFDPWSG